MGTKIKNLILLTLISLSVLFFQNCGEFAGNQSSISQLSETRSQAEILFPKVQAIVQKNCVSCHQVGGQAGSQSLTLQSAEEYIQKGWVVPGDLEQSKLVYRTQGYEGQGNDQSNMPLGSQLDYSDFNIIRSWVLALAQKSLPPKTQSLAMLGKKHIFNTLAKSFGISSNQLNFFENTLQLRYSNQFIDSNTMSDTDSYFQFTEKLAFDHLQKFLICPINNLNETCIRDSLALTGKKLFRRSLTDKELNRYLSIVDSQGSGYRDLGLPYAFVALFNSPHFLYQKFYGENGRLNQQELASRLGFFLMGSNPDLTLIDAAEEDMLLTSSHIASQVNRILSDSSQTARLFEDYVSEFWGINHANESATASLFKEEFENLKPHLLEEFSRTSQSIYLSGGGKWSGIYSSPVTIVNKFLYDHYNLSGPAPSDNNDWKTVNYQDKRRGLLSSGIVLASHSGSKYSSNIHRGLFIKNQLLCGQISPPPQNIEELSNEAGLELLETDSVRQRVDKLVNTPPCSSCHSQFDPYGIVMANFDNFGRYSETRFNEPVESEYSINGMSAKNLNDLSQVLMNNPESLKKCFVRHLYNYATGISTPFEIDVVENLSVEQKNQEFFDNLVKAIATDDRFRQVTTRGESAP